VVSGWYRSVAGTCSGPRMEEGGEGGGEEGGGPGSSSSSDGKLGAPRAPTAEFKELTDGEKVLLNLILTSDHGKKMSWGDIGKQHGLTAVHLRKR
jgi:hypothetical protein